MSPSRYFRQARPASTGWNLWKTFLQSIVFWGVFLFVLPVSLRWFEGLMGWPAFHFTGQIPVAVVLFLVTSALNVWTAVTMAVVGRGTPLPTDCPRHLVVAGPYRWVRNPMAVAGLSQGLAVGLGLGSWLMPAVVVAGGLLWNYTVRPVEEEHLEQLFGDEYAEYRERVKCWWPC